ncbi:LacI family DNA-binding transcriptional regulator [Amphiplicatus metriothermophilus]|uniref:Transcriptional regulator, LacI family n=1 Tax=Amphiplicatus metriothermophilus TaxID=1519374 RepID=A0A239PTB1_9PROT|nr:LacI family DNA-binding transcriptional regulator [Amphiplicatus metriothermophilus]MBB5519385.1 LacI family transcriptional regulator [Amphiplicatus metriothermophilus]SNT73515.1 transcriptional regulator, LacI family [Amphiplicatus metriothermophilus]
MAKRGSRPAGGRGGGAPEQEPPPRDRSKVTINDIARLANVSKKTVSRVINESPLVRSETRERVLTIIKQHGYTPDPQARALALRRSFLIGMIYDNPSPQYVVNMQRGILDELEDTSFQLVLRPCDRADPRFHEKIEAFVVQQKPFGVILPPSVSEDEKLAEMLRALNCDYVRIASVVLDEPARMVRTHDFEGAAAAARHIAALGHSRIAHIHGPKTFRSAHERLAGFRQGLAESAIELDKALTVEGGYTFESGVECAARLFRRKQRPTAIFAGNDEMAVGVYKAARDFGLKAPEDVSIVGFDDTPMASRVWPPMTTVRLPIRDMGRAAARLLLRQAAGVEPEELIAFKPELIIRESAAPPKNG